jgi:hypothetical protein
MRIHNKLFPIYAYERKEVLNNEDNNPVPDEKYRKLCDEYYQTVISL